MLWLTLLIAAGVLSLLLVPIVSAREPWDLDETPDRLRNLKRSRDRIMRTLKDLENDLREGSLAKEDYEALRDTYRRQAVDATRELRRVRDVVIRQIREGPEVAELTDDDRRLIESMVTRRKKKHE